MKLAERDRNDSFAERNNDILVNVVKNSKKSPEDIAKEFLARESTRKNGTDMDDPGNITLVVPHLPQMDSDSSSKHAYIIPSADEISQEEFDTCLELAIAFVTEMLGRRVMARSARGTSEYRPFFSLNWCINTCLKGKGSFKATNLGKNLRRRTGLGAKFDELKCESQPEFDIPRKDIIFVDRVQMSRCMENLYANPNVKELAKCRSKIEKVAVRLVAGCEVSQQHVEALLNETDIEVKKTFIQFLDISREDVNIGSGKDPSTRLKCAGLVNSRDGLRPCKSFPVRGNKFCKIHSDKRGAKRKGEKIGSDHEGRKRKQFL